MRLQADVRADPRQHVVPGQQQVLGLLVQAQVSRRVPWRPDCSQPPTRQRHQVTVLEQTVRIDHPGERVPVAGLHAQLGDHVGRHAAPAQPGQVALGGASALDAQHRKRLALGRVHRDPGAALRTQPSRHPVVIGVNVRDDDPRHVRWRQACRLHAVGQRVPASVGVPAWVDDHEIAVGGDEIGQGVAERVIGDRHRDRPQIGPDLLDRRPGSGDPGLSLSRPRDAHASPCRPARDAATPIYQRTDLWLLPRPASGRVQSRHVRQRLTRSTGQAG